MIIQTGFRLAMSAFAIVCACAAGAAHAQVSKNIINAATVPKYPPFEFRDPASNKLIGFDVDIVDALAAKMGAKVNWVESSFDQLISSITTKRVDVIVAGMNDLPERRCECQLPRLSAIQHGVLYASCQCDAFPDYGCVVRQTCGHSATHRMARSHYEVER